MQKESTTKSGPPLTWSHGAAIRGPRNRKQLALVFTGGDFAEGLEHVLDTLSRHGAPGSFFFTGGFLRHPMNHDGILRAKAEGHYVGPHSDRHLLYCAWEARDCTLVQREEFFDDLCRNLGHLAKFGVENGQVTWWIPPYEWYNEEVAAWAREAGYPFCSFTPGTLSHADYTEDDAGNYRSSDEIFESIFSREGKDPDGLNGFLLLSHVGAGDGRTDKFFLKLDAMISELKNRGYSFCTVADLLGKGRPVPRAEPGGFVGF